MEWEKVGDVGVDAGGILICDPCYAVGDEPQLPHPWKAFCDAWFAAEEHGVAQFPFRRGHEGAAIVVQSGVGDGFYPVFVKRDKSGRVAAVKVEFL